MDVMGSDREKSGGGGKAEMLKKTLCSLSQKNVESKRQRLSLALA
jgi:hypothetical protein